jgi:GTP-dependent phosphoenolpyruvate carboxykinase
LSRTRVTATETEIRLLPPVGEDGIDLHGLDISDGTNKELLAVDKRAGSSSFRKCTSTTPRSTRSCPKALHDQLDALDARLHT